MSAPAETLQYPREIGVHSIDAIRKTSEPDWTSHRIATDQEIDQSICERIQLVNDGVDETPRELVLVRIVRHHKFSEVKVLNGEKLIAEPGRLQAILFRAMREFGFDPSSKVDIEPRTYDKHGCGVYPTLYQSKRFARLAVVLERHVDARKKETVAFDWKVRKAPKLKGLRRIQGFFTSFLS